MTAVLSIVILVGAIGVKIDQVLQDKNSALTVVASAAAANPSAAPAGDSLPAYSASSGASTATTTDPYDPSVISNNVADALAADYTLLQSSGTFSSTTADQAAQALGQNLKAHVTYKTYAITDIPTSPDTAYSGMLAYRAKLQISLAPLLKNKTAEIDMLTGYEQTKDPAYLTQLQQAADNYKLAAAATAQISVPADAATVQVGILNAMQEFAATLDQMSAHASDPLAEATLINTYMQAQGDMFSSFNNLYAYYKSKHQ